MTLSKLLYLCCISSLFVSSEYQERIFCNYPSLSRVRRLDEGGDRGAGALLQDFFFPYHFARGWGGGEGRSDIVFSRIGDSETALSMETVLTL